MPILFTGEIHVHYGQFYVESRVDEFFDALTEARGGQTNGLCGAAIPGLLFLTTGLHTGMVELAVELLDAPAPVGDEWEDVVEASFRPATETVAQDHLRRNDKYLASQTERGTRFVNLAVVVGPEH